MRFRNVGSALVAGPRGRTKHGMPVMARSNATKQSSWIATDGQAVLAMTTQG
jgi:hypothetical protein